MGTPLLEKQRCAHLSAKESAYYFIIHATLLPPVCFSAVIP